MRFVPVKTTEQQATQLLHRGREQLVPLHSDFDQLNLLGSK
jgi:transposase